jgi:type I restriction enzyme S subunit
MNTEITKKLNTDSETIPKNWRLLPLIEAVNFNPKRELKKGQQTKFVAMTDVQPFTKKILTYSVRDFSGGSKFKNGDTLMARITPCLENGKTAFVDFLEKDEVAGGSTEFIVLSGKNQISDSSFVYYLTISPTIREASIKAMTGTSGRQRVENSKLVNQMVKLPPITEQIQIAEVLSSIDDKIKLNDQINTNLEKLASSIFKEWFGDNSSKKWPITTIGDVVTNDKNSIVDGPFGTQMKISEYTDHGVPVIEMGYLEGYPFYKPFKNYVSEEKYEEVKRSTVRNGDLVISKTGTLGLLGIMTDLWDKAILVSRLAKITPDNQKVNRYFLFQILKNFQKEKYWDMQSSGSTMPIINLTHIKSAKFVLPPIELQNKFGDIVENFYKMIHKNLLETQNLSQIKDSLLSRLMSGNIRVN